MMVCIYRGPAGALCCKNYYNMSCAISTCMRTGSWQFGMGAKYGMIMIMMTVDFLCRALGELFIQPHFKTCIRVTTWCRHYLPYLVTIWTISRVPILLAVSFYFYVRVTLYKFIVLYCSSNEWVPTPSTNRKYHVSGTASNHQIRLLCVKLKDG